MSGRAASGQIHPATSLAGFLFFAASLPALPGAALAAVLALSLASAVLFARSRLAVLLRRCRFLILALCVLHAWFTPGEALWGGALAALAPSREGSLLAFEHLARLLALLAGLSMLLEKLSTAELVAATLPLLTPLRLIAVDPRRAALRLALVLELLERSDPTRSWKEWIGLAEDGQGEHEAVHLSSAAWKIRDCVLISLFALACAGVWSLAR
ncbi:hypothetical protein [Niveibacterium terrae]|uniref:hypothetical protein n=1 Tax=Niveibacterium terrae TaxID=3373598 RepID=UPI003A90BCBE